MFTNLYDWKIFVMLRLVSIRLFSGIIQKGSNNRMYVRKFDGIKNNL